ncbi:MAG: hypothetical protein IJM85_06200, partial [Clostridia bacterium]|nr:hypothetical protein [Clostridia bacterium]
PKDPIGNNSMAATVLALVQPCLIVLAVVGWAGLKIGMTVRNARLQAQGIQIPFEEGGPELMLMLILFYILAIGVFTATASLIVRSKTWGWTKKWVLPLDVCELILGAYPLYYLITNYIIRT